MFTHACKCKNDTVETVTGIGEGSGGKKWRGEFKYDVRDTL
jgi:hypothetical protein